MANGRNTSGQFTKGHGGFKPRGAVSRKKQKLDQRFDLIFSQLDMRMEDAMSQLTPQQLVKLYIELTKMVLPKLQRIPYVPDPPDDDDEPDEEEEQKVNFKFICVNEYNPPASENSNA